MADTFGVTAGEYAGRMVAWGTSSVISLVAMAIASGSFSEDQVGARVGLVTAVTLVGGCCVNGLSSVCATACCGGMFADAASAAFCFNMFATTAVTTLSVGLTTGLVPSVAAVGVLGPAALQILLCACGFAAMCCAAACNSTTADHAAKVIIEPSEYLAHGKPAGYLQMV